MWLARRRDRGARRVFRRCRHRTRSRAGEARARGDAGAGGAHRAPGVADHAGRRRGPRALDAAGDHCDCVARARAVGWAPQTAAPALADDARLIRMEVDRCQAILDQMSGRAGGMRRRRSRSRSIVPAGRRRRFAIDCRIEQARVSRLTSLHGDLPRIVVPRAGLGQVRALAREERLRCDRRCRSRWRSRSSGIATLSGSSCGIRACGMPADVLRRAGEPFLHDERAGARLRARALPCTGVCRALRRYADARSPATALPPSSTSAGSSARAALRRARSDAGRCDRSELRDGRTLLVVDDDETVSRRAWCGRSATAAST